MTLEEMLQYVGKEFLDDRVDLVDGDNDSLWSDEYLVRQFNEAQRILCRRSWAIIEFGVAPAGVIVLQAGRSLYSLHPSVLRVFDGTPTTQVSPLGRTEDIQLRNTNLLNQAPGSDAFDAYEVGERASLAGNLTNTAGPPLAFASDAGSRTLRVFPPPTVDQNGLRVVMKVARLPINYLTLDDVEAEPEVPEEFHMAIGEYAAGKALTLPNVDGDQKVEGRRLLDQFDKVVREAKQERIRAEASTARWNFTSSTAVIGQR